MDTDSIRPAATFKRFGKNPFLWAILLISTLSAKLLHLYSHGSSLPILLYLLYMPTFLALDLLNTFLFWVVVHFTGPGRLNILFSCLRGAFCLLVLGASSVQIAFYLETGAEIKWKAAKSLASDKDGFKVALTGSVQAMFVAILIVAVAFAISQPLYNFMHRLLSTASGAFRPRRRRSLDTRKEAAIDSLNPAFPYATSEFSEDSDNECLLPRHSIEVTPLLIEIEDSCPRNLWIIRISFLVPFTLICILLAVRPGHFPYAHMSTSLPYTLAEIWNPFDTDICEAGHFGEFPHYPLEELVQKDLWEVPKDGYIGWMPIANMTVSWQAEHTASRPRWLPEEPVQGLERWYQPPHEEHYEVTSKGRISRPDSGPPPHRRPGRPRRPHGGSHHPPPHPPPHHRPFGGPKRFQGVNYDPVTDPMRVSNLDQDILAPISEALKYRKIKIRHIVLLALESTRKDVFPFKKDSHLHELILKTHKQGQSVTAANEALSQLTGTAEILTGETTGFGTVSNGTAQSGRWRALPKERGGLNVQGAMTGSTTSLKSMLESHCGVQPLAVDFTVEAQRQIYQPCIPSILALFNAQKSVKDIVRRKAGEFEFVNMPWRSVYVQAITDQFDHQDELNEQVGFDEIIVKNTLLDPESKHFPPTEKQSNYFGFPETQVKPYIEDAFRQAAANGERLFLSHLTSSTHHPWNLPDGSSSLDYLKRQGPWKKEHELNRYLNTIRYVDDWIAQIMDMLEDMKVADETLVVMVGDHGMAFEEDSPTHTTYENGHISNLKVPLNFYHPSLPRIQLNINATSLSIIPTILDLLVTTSSINNQDVAVASDLVQQYEGQSLIRPYLNRKDGRQAWNVAVLNAGGAVLSVSSAAVPYRLVMPICKSGNYRFTANQVDPNEIDPVEGNSVAELIQKALRSHGADVEEWLQQAEQIGKYWVLEQRRRWRYNGASLQDDRTPEELAGSGKERKLHWWDT